ncbi:MAG: Uma2 family endonuclease [Pyrinomonadaceae bacterium]|nr:Uma2 family endonuclease [Pyrinomonadaceae bacterium]
MSVPLTLPTFTPEEYLSLERPSEIRHEFLDGYVYAMAGESPTHSTICFNLAVTVGSQLKGSTCRGYSPNMKVRTGSNKLFAYPDLMVVCGEPVFHDDQRDVVVNPTVIFEVLSRSTEAYDRGEKSLRYGTQINSLLDYVLVAQDKPHVEHFSRQPDGSWPNTIVEGLTSSLNLPSINCQISLADVYDRIDFPRR